MYGAARKVDGGEGKGWWMGQGKGMEVRTKTMGRKFRVSLRDICDSIVA